ncbi:MAG: cyclomaltodextrinase C-terminal domain-containing protein [Flavobacteriales bacterium]|nr:cyclomaltodextrinase C-terminal domain-containing protein [Flavobacteriales bacterium]
MNSAITLKSFRKLISTFLVFFSVLPFSSGQNIERIDPPYWYKGFQDPKLDVLIKLDRPLENLSAISCSDLNLNNRVQYTIMPNSKYVLLKLDLSFIKHSQLLSFAMHFTISGEPKTLAFNYLIKEKKHGNFIGLNSGDFIYLLMPDRFSDGDVHNNNIPEMRESKINRDSVSTRHGGDLQGVIDHLDHIKSIGATALWMTPFYVNDQPKASYHGYAISDHYKIDPRFGNFNLCDSLVKRTENAEIKLVLDVVYNHVGSKHYLYEEMPDPDWFHLWDTFTRTNYKASLLYDPYASLTDKKIFSNGWFDKHMPDLNQQNQELATYLIQNTLWWIELMKIKGIRIDTYPYSDQVFMKALTKKIQLEYPDIGIFGEVWVKDADLQSKFIENNAIGLTDFHTYFALTEALNEGFGWNSGLNKLYNSVSKDHLYLSPLKNVIFLDNHDLSRFYSVIGEDLDKFKMGIGFLLTGRGTPCIYYGTEVLMKNFCNPDGLVREDFPGGWKVDKLNKFKKENRSSKENYVFEYVQKIAEFRKNSNALKFGSLSHFLPQDGHYEYFRTYQGEMVMVIMNQNTLPAQIDPVRYSELLQNKKYGIDIVTNKRYTFEGKIEVPANSALILDVK